MSSEQRGRLYLVPNGLGGDLSSAIPQGNLDTIHRLTYWIAENPKRARDFLKRIGSPVPIQAMKIEKLDKNTPPSAMTDLLAPILSGSDAGIISEAGCPAIADPGAELTRRAHNLCIQVIPLVGPSSLMMALMASGLEGQRFHFHGYLPVEDDILAKRLLLLEQESAEQQCTQIFIETPYRNQRLVKRLLSNLSSDTLLCIACDLTLPSETIATKPVSEWQQRGPHLEDGHPAVFLLLARKRERAIAQSPRRGRRISPGR